MAEQKVLGLTPNPPKPDDWVEMKHEGIDGTMRCHPRAVRHWEARKWTVVATGAGAPVTAEQVAAGEAPAQSADKATWVEHAVASGADRAEAEKLTKAQLIEQYGADLTGSES